MSIGDQALRALKYIENTGGSVSVKVFDDDHEPIGKTLRRELADCMQVVTEGKEEPHLSLSEKGTALLREAGL